MENLDHDLIHRALFGLDDEDVRQHFLAHFLKEIKQFESTMVAVLVRWRDFEKSFRKDQDSGTVVGVLYMVIVRLIQSMNLLKIGNITLAGAAMRQVIEAIALSLLFSKIELPYLKLAWEKKFSVNKAIIKIKKHHKKLNLNEEALNVMEKSQNFYDELSHPTIFSMGDNIQLDGPGIYYLGASFDKSKLQFYQKEINSRVGLANILINIIDGVTRQMRDWPNLAKC